VGFVFTNRLVPAKIFDILKQGRWNERGRGSQVMADTLTIFQL
jgi:hypothetical protein